MNLAIAGIFCLILDLRLSTPFDINCTLTVNNSEYTCEMTDLQIDRNSCLNNANVNETIKLAVGNFTVISYHTQSTHYLPIKICSYFTSLRVIDISANNLKEISRSNFENCTKVNVVKIVNSEIIWLNEDVFIDIVELTQLNLTNNQLVFLHHNLLSHNEKLQFIDLSRNRLMIFYMVLPKSVTKFILDENCIQQPGVSIATACQQKCNDATLDQCKCYIWLTKEDTNRNDNLPNDCNFTTPDTEIYADSRNSVFGKPLNLSDFEIYLMIVSSLITDVSIACIIFIHKIIFKLKKRSESIAREGIRISPEASLEFPYVQK